jgi:hypothetical protein
VKRLWAVLAGGLLACLVLGGCVQEAQQDVNQIAPAQDTAAETTLQDAATAAKTASAESGSYAGLTAAVAAQTEPSVQWTDGAPAAVGQVSIRAASATGVVLVTKADSGNILCIGLTPTGQSEGKQDATSAAGCTGGW